jgi:hypothetical protein
LFLLLLHAGVLCYVSLERGERQWGEVADSPFSHNGLIRVFYSGQLRRGVKYLSFVGRRDAGQSAGTTIVCVAV